MQQWGDDPWHKRCTRCGTISAHSINSEAKYLREKQPERLLKQHHSFDKVGLDPHFKE